MERAERQRRAAAPAAHDLRGQELFVFRAGGVGLQVATECSNALVQLPEGDVGSVPAENLGSKRLDAADLVGIAEDEFTRFERLFVGIGSRDSTPVDGRVADPVAEAEGLLLRGQRVAVLAPYRGHPG